MYCCQAFAGGGERPVGADEGGLGAEPVAIVPEAPEQDGLNPRMAEGRAEQHFEAVGADSFVGMLGTDLSEVEGFARLA